MRALFDWQRLEAALAARLNGERLQHTYGVVKTALDLARRYGADPDRARAAALMHDYAKAMPVADQMAVAQRRGLIFDPLMAGSGALLHAHVGAALLEEEGLVTDPAVLDAVRWHTTGRPGMGVLEKILWIADLVEPGRSFPGVDRIRELTWQDLDLGLMAGLDHTIGYVLATGRPLLTITVETRNWLLGQLAAAGKPWPGYRYPG